MQKTSTPERQGIPSEAIRRLVNKVQEHHLPLHSLLVARHGCLVAELYFAPFERDTLHRMYSETKSLVSLAIGLLVSEGKLRLSDPICRYFPEYLPQEVHPWLAELTIGQMLKMETCHCQSTYREDDESFNWAESFFTTEPRKRPGTVFQYDTSSTHVLGALAEKLTGTDLMTFLRGQLLEEIGFSKESYIMKDRFGVSKGGSGLMAKPRDMLRLGLLLLHHGIHPDDSGNPYGRQVYPRAYLDEALSAQTSTFLNPFSEYECGYGYQFWMLPGGAFKMFGMASQDTFCFPNEDMVVVTTADTQTVPKGSDILYSDIVTELLEKLSDVPLPEEKKQTEEFAAWCGSLTLPVLRGEKSSVISQAVSQETYQLLQNSGGFEQIRLVFETGEKGFFEYKNGEGSHRIRFGLGHLEEDRFPGYHWRCAASGAWLDSRVFAVRIWIIDRKVSSVHLKFAFLPDGGLTVLMKETEEGMLHEFNGVLNGRAQAPEKK